MGIEQFCYYFLEKILDLVSFMTKLFMYIFCRLNQHWYKKYSTHTHWILPGSDIGLKDIDTYAKSLLYVNNIFNANYKFQIRKVPSHMPHLIDKTVMKSLQTK